MRLKNIVTIMLVIGIASSCTKDLDLYPKDQVSDGSFWNTSRDFELAANAFYGNLPGFSYPRDTDSEIAFGQGPNPLSNGSYLPPDESGLWNGAYASIRGINYLLQQSGDYAYPNEIERSVGEAYFFRAFNYFNLLSSFGGVPIITDVLDTDSDQLLAPRNSRVEVADFIISDLQKAIDRLPSQSEIPANELGKVSKEAAQAFLSRVALFEGTWAKFHGGEKANERLEIAVQAAKAVIDGGQFSLFTAFGTEESYRKLFIEAGEDSEEVILSRRYVLDINGTHNATRWLEQNIQNPTRRLVDSYLSVDGLPISDSPLFMGYNTMTSEFENRDSRLMQTVLKPGVEYVGGGAAIMTYEKPKLDGALTRTGYTNYKFLGETEESWAGRAEYDNIVFRYGEVLLNYAEAKFELNGNISDEDLNLSINKLRDRVGMPHLTNAHVENNMLDMQTEIRRERKVELALEGFRRDDLNRWKIAEEVLPKAIKGIKFVGTQYETEFPEITPGVNFEVDSEGYIIAEPASNRNFEVPKHYLWPLPKKQLNLNPNLEQNPGW
ncbi:RagB/SusD family nutrient uptake outer membrane protein [Salegentibacter sp. BLCTC]|uniref:Starch-binding associating with outer membrane n=1 Tax=Salegentibacter echinorum TaxID=1073325 RepID=A0A1M5FQA9_SALEC|nr:MULTISPECIES: RagB/SusD family nutrient uptake outer membrane protein [Salegentibacter]MBE7639100.1 RagB/SusD family nutrient uptake outer membrane protein [Salegentibacter sp. BLCTC]SHF93683.1 Starch-binding associating with outer membrane [Salegentibacter echinorum]